MDQHVNEAREIPLHSGAAIRQLAGQWADKLPLTGGTIGTAAVLKQLAAMVREAGVSYLSPADLDTMAAAVHPVAAEPGAPQS